MPLRPDWEAQFPNNVLQRARFICPHCELPSTFQTVAHHQDQTPQHKTKYWAIMKCEYAKCRQNVFVITTRGVNQPYQDHTDSLEILPSGPIPKAHESLPGPIAEDWIEAQVDLRNGALKSAAVMCRRILYGVLLDKGCKEHPLHEGIQELAAKERLPRVVEEWLREIKEDGHDAAHPQRALHVPAENVAETIEYTQELLRFVYVEPHELQKRLSRKAGATVASST